MNEMNYAENNDARDSGHNYPLGMAAMVILIGLGYFVAGGWGAATTGAFCLLAWLGMMLVQFFQEER